MTKEELRLQEDRDRKVNWQRWGPYLSERQWGTVREDYSPDGRRLGLFLPTIRPAAERTAGVRMVWPGFCRPHQYDLLRLGAVERSRPDPERTTLRPYRQEGNHGEDVKECYFLPGRDADAFLHEDTCTSIRRPNFPTRRWSKRTAGADGTSLEFELINTGVFDEDRYFDVFVEYAKGSPEIF